MLRFHYFFLRAVQIATKRYFNPFYQWDFIWNLTNYPNVVKNGSKYREELFEKVNSFWIFFVDVVELVQVFFIFTDTSIKN